MLHTTLHRVSLITLLLTITAIAAHAQGWGEIRGAIHDKTTGQPIVGATVLVTGTNYGTAADTEGRFQLRLPEGRYLLQFSAIGYLTYRDSVYVQKDHIRNIDVFLTPTVIQIETVTTTAEREKEVSVYRIDPDDVRRIPTPVKDGFRMLKLLPGVATNNELSGEYSVRGGGYNENLIFLNGFEIYRPFRARKGEQEGLGLINPELARDIVFYSGGFPARYGGKLSSALEVTYDAPEDTPLQGATYASLLDVGATLKSSLLNNRLRWVLGVRKARPRQLFETQELKGTYDPSFSDAQLFITYQLTPRTEIQGLGILARQRFRLIPTQQKTYFGTYQDLRSVWINFSGQEEDGYDTYVWGTRIRHRFSPSLSSEHDIAIFSTDERERFDISGDIAMFRVKNPLEGSDNNPDDHIPLGSAFQTDEADNRIKVLTTTLKGRWTLNRPKTLTEGGWYLRKLAFDDWLYEATTVRGKDSLGNPVEVPLEVNQDASTFQTYQAGGYLQHSLTLRVSARPLVITGGLRVDYFAFNGETTFSPRLLARYTYSTRTTFNAAWGVYYQTPTYRELRGKVSVGSTIEESLNRNLKSQRAIQYILGVEHFFPRRRLILRAEAYYKALSNLISYDLNNVRITYSGENDSEGYTYGLDLQLKGEFVPGLESWINYSYLVARERFLPPFQTPYNRGYRPRPADQRHTFSLFIQDYVPGFKNWRLHLRMLFGSGFPYTSPRPGKRIGNIQLQEPGERNGERYPPYRRVDIGATRELKLSRHPDLNLELTAELLNVFDMVNTVAYTWISGTDGTWQRVPTHLTPRTFNLRARIAF